MAPYWMPSLRYVRNLRQVADRVVVYLFDSWLIDLPALQADRDLWKLIDDLVVSFKHTVEPYAAGLPCRVHYLPQAADPRWFAPHDGPRPIDVLSLGRRLPEVHSQLLESHDAVTSSTTTTRTRPPRSGTSQRIRSSSGAWASFPMRT